MPPQMPEQAFRQQLRTMRLRAAPKLCAPHFTLRAVARTSTMLATLEHASSSTIPASAMNSTPRSACRWQGPAPTREPSGYKRRYAFVVSGYAGSAVAPPHSRDLACAGNPWALESNSLRSPHRGWSSSRFCLRLGPQRPHAKQIGCNPPENSPVKSSGATPTTVTEWPSS